MDNKKNLRNLLIYLGAPVLIIVIMASIYGNTKPQKTHEYSEIVDYFKSQQVIDYTMSLGSGEVQVPLKDGMNVTYTASNVAVMYDETYPYIEQYNEDHPDKNMEYDPRRPAETPWFMSLIPTVLLLTGIFIFQWFTVKRLNISIGDVGKQMNFDKAKIKQVAGRKHRTTFADMTGAGEEEEKLRRVVEFLKNPKKHDELGARIPKDVLFVDPPGIGRMLLTYAVAGEMGAPFFSISGSDFVEMLVDVGASRMRDLFDQVKKSSPCVIFIDEVNMVGRQRGTGLGSGHDKREQTLNQLLVGMDGFGVNEGVIMIATTNRPDILDPALMRPGRFNRQVMADYPDIKGHEEILKVHARDKPTTPNVSLKTVAKSTAGLTNVSFENLLNEAALLSARKSLRAIATEKIEEVAVKVVVSTEKKSRAVMKEEKTLTAYHEGGHMVATYFCPTQDPVHQISIIPRDMAGSYTMQLPVEGRSYKCRKEMLEDLIVLMDGRVAEVLVLDSTPTGASNDIEHATKTARAIVTKYGMSEMLGTATYGSDNSEPFLGRDMGHVRNYSESIAVAIDQKIKDILTSAYDGATKILSDHMDEPYEVAKYLYRNEKISGEDFQKLMSGTALSAVVGQIPPLPKLDMELPQVGLPPADETAE